ncbi:MAG: helix-turn-helix transcriptional regulator [Defluviitaleaceae bacterium]|nr:helix-turn-helix transcriptional regulator [Defluviitaleaceae bacterium]
MDRKLEKDRLDIIVGGNIRLEREARNLSRDELAQMVNVTTSHLGLIERGERGTTTVTLSLLTKAFGIPIDHLFISPHKRGHTVRDDVDPSIQANREKIQSLMTCLGPAELEFTLRMLKAIIAMNNSMEDVD